MVADIRVEGADKFGILGKALRKYGDKELRKELYAGINRAVKPLTESVKDSTTQYFPRRYALELAKYLRVRTRRRAGKDPAIYLVGRAKTKQGKDRDLASLNRGRLRHPLYGNRRYWYDQDVDPNWWDDPLIQGSDQVREEIVNVLDDIGIRLAKQL
ncbi:hypothetical protein [Kribbella sp. NPDC050470]|uniref:hypothetical protein n=1 Tax=unclassified Kribbella TaxID=2644121 RepID=UPI00379753F2